MIPQQRKPPVKRLFTGMAGSPLSGIAPTNEPAAVSVPASVDSTKLKRGRPPKGDRPMTDAERKREQRARVVHESSAPEREELITRIKKRIKTSEHANLAAMKRALAQFHDTLALKSLDDLHEIAKTYRIHDRKGRSSLEGHSGGKDMDKIDAAVQRDENGQKPRTGMTAEMFKDTPFSKMNQARPTGVSKWDIPLDYVQPSGPGLQDWNVVETVWDFIPEFTEAMFEGDEKDFDAEYDPDEIIGNTLFCRVRGCDFHTSSWFEARKHVEQILMKAEQQIKFVEQLKEVVDGGTAGYDSALVDAQKVFNEQYWPHHTWVRHKWENEFRDKPSES